MRFFISYAKKDTRDLAFRLHSDLNSIKGVTAWIDEAIRPGKGWSRQIADELKKSNTMLVLLSEDIHRDPDGDAGQSFVINEIDFAISNKIKIIPLLVQRDTPLPLQIISLQYIDFTQSYDSGMQLLLDVINSRKPQDDFIQPQYSVRLDLPLSEPSLQITQRHGLIGMRGTFGIFIGVFLLLVYLFFTNLNQTLQTQDNNVTLSAFQQVKTAEAQQTAVIETQISANTTETEQFILDTNATGTMEKLNATETLAQSTLIWLSATAIPPTPTPTHTPDLTLVVNVLETAIQTTLNAILKTPTARIIPTIIPTALPLDNNIPITFGSIISTGKTLYNIVEIRDINLPNCNGIATVRRVRTIAHSMDNDIFILSGFDDEMESIKQIEDHLYKLLLTDESTIVAQTIEIEMEALPGSSIHYQVTALEEIPIHLLEIIQNERTIIVEFGIIDEIQISSAILEAHVCDS